MLYVVIDRDGTLIRHIPYLCDPSQVEVLPTFVEGLGMLVGSGLKLFLHTNQSGVGRGYFSMADVVSCNDAMLSKIGLGTDVFTDICICREAPYQDISYRKPSSKYGLEILNKYRGDTAQICYIGDNVTDLLTAKNIGCAGLGVDTGGHDLRNSLLALGLQAEFPVFNNFLDAAKYVVQTH